MKKLIKPVSAVLLTAMLLIGIVIGIGSSAAAKGMAGDVNMDGQLNNKDIVALFRYTSGVEGLEVDVTACDTNGDGTVNNKDVVNLFRYLSGGDNEIFYGTEEDTSVELTFNNSANVSDYLSSIYVKASKSDDNTILITSDKKAPTMTFNAQKLAGYNGTEAEACRYFTVKYKAASQNADTGISLKSVTAADGKTYEINQRANMDTKSTDWQGAMFDMKGSAALGQAITKFVIQLNSQNTSGGITEIGGFFFTNDMNKALTYCNHSEYCLNYDYDLTDNDPLAHTVLKADNEDETVKLWFDHSTEKLKRSSVTPTDRTGYTVRMAKNEAENCQFFMSPEKTFNVNVVVDEFRNESGKTVPFELYYEYYHNITGELVPDALPPFTSPISVEGGFSQAFIIQLTSLPETEAGTYNSTVHIYDADTGAEIKRAAVAVKVWDFELSEKTELCTAFNLWGGYIENSYSQQFWETSGYSHADVYDNYFEFFLKYRVNIMNVSHGITSGYGANHMSKDRVNTGGWYNYDVSVTEDLGYEPAWKDKVIYYPGDCDEPRTNTQFANLINYKNRIIRNTPDYRMVIPMERNLDLTDDGTITTFAQADTDSVGFLSRAVNVWCPKISAFTTRDLGFISRAEYLQTKEQDEKYGEFLDRIRKEVAEGDELWTYICMNPTEPYVNWQLLSDGTEAVVSAWQMKKYDITGVLYWAANLWKVNYWNQSQPWTGDSYGDGFLVYSGYSFGLPYPIASMRLEGIRDGIEDYQMLCMLEEALGEEAADEMVNRVATSVLTYTSDDDYLHAVRVLLGDTLEAALR